MPTAKPSHWNFTNRNPATKQASKQEATKGTSSIRLMAGLPVGYLRRRFLTHSMAMPMRSSPQPGSTTGGNQQYRFASGTGNRRSPSKPRRPPTNGINVSRFLNRYHRRDIHKFPTMMRRLSPLSMIEIVQSVFMEGRRLQASSSPRHRDEPVNARNYEVTTRM